MPVPGGVTLQPAERTLWTGRAGPACRTLPAARRLFKRSVRFVIEVVLAVAALAFATRLGWVHW